jgi:hypothetical protein
MVVYISQDISHNTPLIVNAPWPLQSSESVSMPHTHPFQQGTIPATRQRHWVTQQQPSQTPAQIQPLPMHIHILRITLINPTVTWAPAPLPDTAAHLNSPRVLPTLTDLLVHIHTNRSLAQSQVQHHSCWPHAWAGT